MLISLIDRNDETGPEKQISRINSPYWTLPTGVELGSSPKSNHLSHSSKGMILRLRDTRFTERRKIATQFLQPERRKSENWKHDSRWNSDSHHILAFAIERKQGELDLFPLLTKDDEDYVVYLSGKSLMDINEKKGWTCWGKPSDGRSYNRLPLTRLEVAFP